MANWSFNPFTGNLDISGSGAVVFEGEVATFADLPVTVGEPAVGASYLVRESTGVWLVNRKQAGIWIRSNNTGVRDTDWTYGGDYPVNSVNGQTGNVSLTASSVGAAAATHASTHHTGGTDAIAPSSIGAQSLFTTTTNIITGNTTIPAGRALIYQVAVTSFTPVTANINLPSSGHQAGDVIVVRSTTPFTSGSTLTIRDGVGNPVDTITTFDQAYRYTSNGSGPNAWNKIIVDTHTHAAADISNSTATGRSLLTASDALAARAVLSLNTGNNVTFGGLQSTPVGNLVPAAGTFTNLSANNGTITASAPVLDLSQTWNNAAVTFTGLRFNVTNTASAAASLLADFQVGGTSMVNITRDGFIGNANAGMLVRATGSFNRLSFTSQGAVRLLHNNSILLNESTGGYGWVASGAPTSLSPDTVLYRDDAGVVGQHGGTSPQAYRLYNTRTDASNFERGFMRWSANVLEIGTEGAGTGSNTRELRLFVGTNEGIRIQNNAVLIRRPSFSINNVAITNNNDAADELGFSLNLRPFSTGNVIINSGLLKFHGVSSSFPALKRSSTALQVRLADDSADAPFSSGAITTSGTVTANNTSSGFVTSSAPNGASPVRFAANTGDVLIQSANAAGIVEFRGTTGTNPQSLRVFNTFTSGTSFERLNIRWASNECIIDAEAGSGGGTLRGIKIGSATSSLLGFYGAVPVDQPATVADPAGGGTVDTEARTAINAIIDRLQELGLIA